MEETTTQYLTFQLKEEAFGIEIQSVKEILEYSEVTKVPLVPDFICGVINVRGSVVPVIDLARRFGKQATEVNRRTCTIIIELAYEDSTIDIGVRVDEVTEVADFNLEQLEDVPYFGSNIRTDFIKKIGKVEEKFVIFLDLSHVLDLEELSVLDSISTADAPPAEAVSA